MSEVRYSYRPLEQSTHVFRHMFWVPNADIGVDDQLVVREWLREQFKVNSKWTTRFWTNTVCTIVYICRDDDAFEFRMRWC